MLNGEQAVPLPQHQIRNPQTGEVYPWTLIEYPWDGSEYSSLLDALHGATEIPKKELRRYFNMGAVRHIDAAGNKTVVMHADSNFLLTPLDNTATFKVGVRLVVRLIAAQTGFKVSRRFGYLNDPTIKEPVNGLMGDTPTLSPEARVARIAANVINEELYTSALRDPLNSRDYPASTVPDPLNPSIIFHLEYALKEAQTKKGKAPNGESMRRHAILVTEIEKVLALAEYVYKGEG